PAQPKIASKQQKLFRDDTNIGHFTESRGVTSFWRQHKHPNKTTMKNHIILTASLMLCLCQLEAQQLSKVSASLAEKHAKEFSTAGDILWNQADRVTFA